MKRRVIMMFLCMLMLVKSASLICANESDEVIKAYGELNQENVEQFFDDKLSNQLNDDEIAGVTVSVVKDGELLFAKSYGYSNHEKQIPYNTETMTRVGSISKVFVWQSILQLADEGKIDIDNHISDYVDELSYENPYDTRITIRHLMTHTAGFEDELTTLFVKNEDPIQSLLDDERKVMYEPGTVIAYSNYGAAIAGLKRRNYF